MTARFYLYLNNGEGSFTQTVTTGYVRLRSLYVADLDGDDRDDLLYGDDNRHRVVASQPDRRHSVSGRLQSRPRP